MRYVLEGARRNIQQHKQLGATPHDAWGQLYVFLAFLAQPRHVAHIESGREMLEQGDHLHRHRHVARL